MLDLSRARWVFPLAAVLAACAPASPTHELVADSAVIEEGHDDHVMLFRSPPDPFVCVTIPGREAAMCSSWARDTTAPHWNDALGVVTEHELRSRFRILLRDDDRGPLGRGGFETICALESTAFTRAAIRARAARFHCNGSSIVLRLRAPPRPWWAPWR